MKRKIFSILALAAVLMSASCAEEDPAKPVDYSAPELQATIQGKLLIIADTTENPKAYSALEGVVITASVDYSELSSSAITSGAFLTTATTDKDGVFTLTVPATASGVTVKIGANGKWMKEGQRQHDANEKRVWVEGIWSFPDLGPDITSVTSGKVIYLSTVIGEFTTNINAGDDVPIK
ncbi:MAG: hypothetical protein LBT49_00105 [Prevotellaceae bacterium]|jgi:hypothetical protein|nr:hypothetical protein [Prevotellaceae bacterium]